MTEVTYIKLDNYLSRIFYLKIKGGKTDELESKINEILSGDYNLDVCTLLRILNNKIKE